MIAIIDYNAGNISSVKRALDFLQIDSFITSDPSKITAAKRLIFPGVGHAGAAMEYLNASGIGRAFKEAVAAGTPTLGICLGTQIIMSFSEEGDTQCLGLINGGVRKLSPGSLKVPHMGWNNISVQKNHPVLQGVTSQHQFYFVHSYFIEPEDSRDVAAVCDYGGYFPVVIAKDNLIATQFHPEKSGPVGLNLLKNFALWEVSKC